MAAHYRLPAIYPLREFVAYGASLAGAYRHTGTYAGQILKGTKPADLPVLQATAFELIMNLKTARELGVTVPAEMLKRADRVIE